jgi:hypothetical protein
VSSSIRIYLESDKRPSLDELHSSTFGNYEVVFPASAVGASSRVVMIRKIEFNSEDEFRIECMAVVGAISRLSLGSAVVCCLYDTSEGVTRFGVNFCRTMNNPDFIELKN